MRLRTEAKCPQVLRHDAPSSGQPSHVAALQKEEVNLTLLNLRPFYVSTYICASNILSCLFLREVELLEKIVITGKIWSWIFSGVK